MYSNEVGPLTGLKDWILLEVGFDDITLNIAKDISSWAYDYAVEKAAVNDNRAKGVLHSSWLYVGGKTASHFHQIPHTATKRGLPHQLCAALLRCVLSA